MKYPTTAALLALALAAPAAAQIQIDQFYNFDGTLISTDPQGNWDVPLILPVNASIYPQQFVEFVGWNLQLETSVSFNILNNTGTTAVVDYDPRGSLGSPTLLGPNPNMATVGELVTVTGVPHSTFAQVEYTQSSQLAGGVFPPVLNRLESPQYNLLTIVADDPSPPIRITQPNGTTTSYTKGTPLIQGWTEDGTLDGVVQVRYSFPFVSNTVTCSGASPLALYGDGTPEGSFLGATGATPNEFGLFVRGGFQAVPGSTGLCVSGAIRMHMTTHQADSTGLLLSQTAGNGPFMTGQTHHFQAWYRQPGGLFAFSDAIEVTFQ